jgi:hypothetical protein
VVNRKCWWRFLGLSAVLFAPLIVVQAVRSEKTMPHHYPFRTNPKVPEKPSDAVAIASPNREETRTGTVRTDSATATADTENPKVEPGAVKWHDSLAAACAAAKKSGKPVLLFQMLGRLDQRFC